MSSLRLTSLPEDCLRLVLEPIPIADQLNIQPVCSRFHNTIQHIFNEKSSLKIFATSWDVHRQWDSIEKYDLVDKPDFAVQASPGANDEVVVLEWLKLPFEKLPKVFPKINRLMVNNCRQQFLNSKFFATIRKWSALKHLSLFGLPEDDALSDNFWTELNTFKHLETLNFGFLYRTTISEQLFPLLSQIQSFTLVTYGGGNLEQLLVQMKSLNILNLSYVHLSVDQLHRALEQNHSLAKKLTYLALDFVSTTNGNRKANYQALFQLICNRMTNLRYFDILFGDDIPIFELLNNLQKLKSLATLRLHLRENQIPKSFCLTQFQQLPQITQLVLEINSDSFFDLINFVFPNLNNLKLRSCTTTELSKVKELVMKQLPSLKKLTIVKF